ncbi:ferritin-like domain-containing protein [Podospora appendiculata]|uniref:Ferritin-like domain-containing protein n=1 Tax=Podospora appendiculata TaxID=314037 RepID=A0AAE0XAK3_9PEZI|nr:ferritin-like domain-containing protein [Podospora appendiculata]
MISHRPALLCCLLLVPFAVDAAPQIGLPRGYSGEAQKLANSTYGPIPGESNVYNYYWGTDRPFPGNITDPIFPTEKSPPGADDGLWQDLLAAGWLMFEFYQQGVERFTERDFVKADMPKHTYRRIQEIRNNAAGHIRIFQNQISPSSIKPGPCKYSFPFKDPVSFLALLTILEISSMTFLTGLAQQPFISASRSALVAIAEVEARHEAWALMDLWDEDPFGGPSDTLFPYANEILESTATFIVSGSCPKENPKFPQHHSLQGKKKLPPLAAAKDSESLIPGSIITFEFLDPKNQPSFLASRRVTTQYYAVFFHGTLTVSIPIETAGWPEKRIRVMVPESFETKGVVVVVIAGSPGAETRESLVTGPAILLQQPRGLEQVLWHAGKE